MWHVLVSYCVCVGYYEIRNILRGMRSQTDGILSLSKGRKKNRQMKNETETNPSQSKLHAYLCRLIYTWQNYQQTWTTVARFVQDYAWLDKKLIFQHVGLRIDTTSENVVDIRLLSTVQWHIYSSSTSWFGAGRHDQTMFRVLCNARRSAASQPPRYTLLHVDEGCVLYSWLIVT